MSESLQSISAENLCAITGLTDRRHRQLAKEGYFPSPIKSQYQLVPALRGLFKFYRGQSENKTGLMGDAKLLREQARARITEADAAERLGEMVRRETVNRAIMRNVVACKTKLGVAENAVAVEAGMRLGFTTEQIVSLREIHAKHNRNALKEMFVGDWGKIECPLCAKAITP